MANKKFDNNNWGQWMSRALQLADLAEGETSPNPLVGALVLDSKGTLVGEGFHSSAGKAHAEVEALSQAGFSAKEGTLIVTLEPCCHHGKTPPCTDLILNSGISRVVIAMQDPDPRVAGEGISILKKSGLEVITGILEEEALSQNRAFIHRVKKGRPWGVLKCALSLDGRIALSNGKSQWITEVEARRKVHILRSKCDAVIVGGETVRSDNPLLTTRGIRKPEPKRVVFSSTLDLPRSANVFETSVAETIIAYTSESPLEMLEHIPKGVEKTLIKESSPRELLKVLATKGCNKVLWECGPSLASRAIQENCVQELVFFIAPKLLGGLPAMTPLSELGFESMDEVLTLGDVSLAKAGKDFVLNVPLQDWQ